MNHRKLAACWTLIALLAAVSTAASSERFESVGIQSDGISGKSSGTKTKSPPKAKSTPTVRTPALSATAASLQFPKTYQGVPR